MPRAYEEKGASEGKKEDGDEAYEGQNESFKRFLFRKKSKSAYGLQEP